ncbi:xanthine dehydrogenase/oxidase-like [Epargyreus clarus]|uniref:xanthine dehydrogenase/oxidase-like n=1 Tax=Epargyreus clarus TaxID=520877 RepID=UPI003C2F2062
MDKIKFKVNGVEYSVGCDVSSTTSLLKFLRNRLELRGTKYMCLEGGCGACIVSVRKCPGAPVQSVNSCLVSITSCKDWEIETIEKVGNRFDGYHPLQKTLAEKNGTQCGYCSPGWVMAMYSLFKGKGKMTMHEIEQSLGSNVCRCTGYRPILEAFKTFASDAPNRNDILDIEDLTICNKTGKACKGKCDDSDWCFVSEDDVSQSKVINIHLKDDKEWFRVEELDDIFKIFKHKGDDCYMLVNGNTGKGVKPIDEYPRLLIDISGVRALKVYFLDQNLVVGGGTTLTTLTEIFDEIGGQDYFSYLKVFNEHLQLVAHIPVKNIGTIAGNLMIKHQHNDFDSDLFLLFETVGAQVTILCRDGVRKTMTMLDFLEENMRGKVLLNILLPPLNKIIKVVTYKIMPRSQNAHAIVNSGYLYHLDKDNKVIACRIAYGGLSPTFTRATRTENELKGKKLFTNETLRSALNVLNDELVVEDMPPAPSVKYRRTLALGLFYKGLLSLCPSNILNRRYKSGTINLHKARPVSDGRQIFETNPLLWPLNQPIPKVEALIQCAGEATFTDDVPTQPREVHAAFALTTAGLGTIDDIDASCALKIPGTIDFFTSKDIPGVNSFTPGGSIASIENEELLCDGTVKYHGQPLGIMVAETRDIAERAAKLVKVKYSNVRKPVIDIKEAKNNPLRTLIFMDFIAKDIGSDIAKVIKNEITLRGQYHFTMETLVSVSRPTDVGIETRTSSQWMDVIQLMTSRVLKIPQNKIDVIIERLGGAYGLKITRATQVAVGCNMVVQKTHNPCRIAQSLETNMRGVGKRLPCTGTYEIAVNKSGVIQYVNYNLYEDNGYVFSEPLILYTLDVYYNCYNNKRWNYKAFNSTTDTASNTWCRSPGTLEAIVMAECMMEHIAYEMSLDPMQVRLANLDSKHDAIKEMYEKLKDDSNYNERRAAVDKFNKENRWKKRGLRFSCMRWAPVSIPVYLDINLSVFTGDGTIVITHSGVEMGQGINTKAVQICAYFLKVPIEKVQIKANNTTSCPNSFVSGGSITSQNVGLGVQRCCEELLKRLSPIRLLLENPTWEQLIAKAAENGLDLQTHGFVSIVDNQIFDAYGVALSEVEIDVITGEYEIRRVDLSEDVGRSVSPEIDIGQVEGAFVMGVGDLTCEELVYDPNTGELLTNRSWDYYVPQARDIPQDFRIYFRKRSYSNDIVLGSKVTGEPATCLAISVPLALREAFVSARSENGLSSKKWYPIDGPYTVEKVCLATATKLEDYKFY